MTTATVTTKCRSLPEDIRRIVRSGIVVTSVSHCVEELVFNSVDAGAENVYISVNFDEFSLEVEDDGCGISKEDLEIVGQRFTTSKCNSFADLSNMKFYGFRGESLASLIDVSTSVKISSKVLENNTEKVVYCKCFDHKNNPPTINREDESLIRYGKGTLVRVTNVLGLFPVRQKRINKVLQLEDIKKSLQYICLINPRVSLTLVDGSDSNPILNVQAKNSTKESFGEIFCKASELMKYSRTLIEEHHQFNSFFFTACISSELYHSNDLQILYINKRFLCRGKVHKSLHRLISQVLGNRRKKKSEKCDPMNLNAGNPLPSESKKFPVFVVNIVCPFNEYDITLQSLKSFAEFCNWEAVLKGCEGLALRFKAIYQSLNKLSAKDRGLHCVFSTVPSTLELGETGFGSKVTTHDVKRALHSKVAVRQDLPGKTNETNNDAASVRTNDSEIMIVSQVLSSVPQSIPETTIIKKLVNGPNLKRRETEKYPFVGKKYKKTVHESFSPNLTAHIFSGFPAFQTARQVKVQPPKTASMQTNEWKTSQEWSNHLQSLSVNEIPNTSKNPASNRVTPNSGKTLNEIVSASKTIRAPTMSPISRSIQKVQSWNKNNYIVNAPQNNKDYETSLASDPPDLNNNATPKKDLVDRDLQLRTSNAVIDKLGMGKPDSRIQIKEDCKKILMSSSAGIKLWNSIQCIP